MRNQAFWRGFKQGFKMCLPYGWGFIIGFALADFLHTVGF